MHTDVQGGMPAKDAEAGPFVLNLCSSTTPMALPKAEQQELKRFSFFVSRRFEEGRERFRLHMGYFATLADAEEWLAAVRDIYPGAWAGEAPGKKLRARAVAAAAAKAQHAAGPPPHAAVTKPAPAAERPGAQVAELTLAESAPELAGLNIPTLQAASAPSVVENPAARSVRPAAAIKPSAAAPKTAVAPPSQVAAKPMTTATPTPAGASLGAPMAATKVVPSAKPAAPSKPTVNPRTTGAARPAPSMQPALASGTLTPNTPRKAAAGAAGQGLAERAMKPRTVTQLMTAPETSAVPSQMPTAAPRSRAQAMPAAASPARAPTQPASNTARVAAPAVRPGPVSAASARPAGKGKQSLPDSNVREVLAALDEHTGETRMMPAPAIAEMEPSHSTLSDTQVLKLLETRRADGSQEGNPQAESGAISLLKPDDTSTVRALKQAVVDNAPVWFAVQLQWSVQAIELAKVPPLAIFSAYTLYSVEGSRDGRKWYGLRLGFFSDAIAAKQVAYYVRSEFTSVAVVPVSPQERTRATDVETAGPSVARPKKLRQEPVDEFKLIDSDDAAVVAPAVAAAVAAKVPAPRRAPAAGKTGARVRARERRGPQSLEETLEILGAGELQMDGDDDALSESGVRHLRVEVQKNSPFGRLLERLSEKVRKP